MLNSLAITALILAWCALLSGLWSQAFYVYLTLRPTRPASRKQDGSGMILPALVIAPVVLLLAFRVLSLNLLFPNEFGSEESSLVAASLAPAAVLFVASGLAGTLSRHLRLEYEYWQDRPFAVAATAFGQNKARVLHRLVWLKAFGSSWAQCLPWLYGELMVVEAVFNAPGLGLYAWHLARIRDHLGLAQAMAALAALYLFTVGATAWGNRRLGRRLDSYA